jgi:hypothetical protein
MMNELAALVDRKDRVKAFVYYSDHGMYYRDQGDWLVVGENEEKLVESWDGLEAVSTAPTFTPRWDMAELSGSKLLRKDVPEALVAAVVRTPEGAKKFGQPIGSTIIKDAEDPTALLRRLGGPEDLTAEFVVRGPYDTPSNSKTLRLKGRGRTVGTLSWYADGKISWIRTDDRDMGTGVGSLLLEMGKALEPRLHHNTHLTKAGKKFAKRHPLPEPPLTAAVVRTPEGAKKFGQPIGSTIIKDVPKTKARLTVHRGGPVDPAVRAKAPFIGPQTPSEALVHSNPLGGGINCQITTLAYELRRRGYDALAKVGSGGDVDQDGVPTAEHVGTTFPEWFGLDEQETREWVSQDHGLGDGKATYRFVTTSIKRQHPSPSRGCLTVIAHDGRCHILNWERDSNGEVAFFDAQVRLYPNEHHPMWEEVGEFSATRLDHRPIVASAAVSLLTREDVEEHKEEMRKHRKIFDDLNQMYSKEIAQAPEAEQEALFAEWDKKRQMIEWAAKILLTNPRYRLN